MRFRSTEKALLFFDKCSGDTGIISGTDFDNVLNWARTGALNPIVIFLISKYKLSETDKNEIELTLKNVYPEIPSAFAIPESLHIEVTTSCSLNCKQCYKNKEIEKDIPYDRLEELIEEAARIGVFQIAFGGGEPLLYPHLIKAVKKVTEYGMGASITTSGARLNEQLSDLIAAGIDHIQISLNGSSEEINSKTRDGYLHAISALQLFNKTKCSYGINMVLSKTNIDDLENMIIYAQKVKAKNINLLRYKPSADYGLEEIDLTQDDYDLIAKLIKKYNSKDFSIKVDSAFGKLVAYIYKDNLDPNFSGCTAGRRFMAVDAEGKFKVCSHLSSSESVKSILDFWRNSRLVKKIRETEVRISEPCKSCVYIRNCRGCRAICGNKYGDFYNGEKDCFVYRRTV